MLKIEGVKETKILLVDDDENYVNVTQMYLKENGLNIVSTTNPKEALEMCKKWKFDIVLLDYFMPQINGDEFLTELRKFNNKILVILQTGFSEKKPPIETLTELDIQAYYDKSKGIDELLLLIISSIKTVRLLKLNRFQEIKINSANYREQLLGEISSGLINEAKDQLFAISAANESISIATKEYVHEYTIIKEANEKVGRVFEALGFESNMTMNLNDIADCLKTLLSCVDNVNSTELVVNIEHAGVILKQSIGTVIFLCIETFLALVKAGEKKIIITFRGKDTVTVTFENMMEYDKEFAKRIITIIGTDTNVKYALNDKRAEITVDNK